MRHLKALAALLLSCGLLFGLAACDGSDHTQQEKEQNQVEKKAAARKGYYPKNDVEYRNYMDAQKLYDSPDTIIWCTTTWGNASAPLVTVPVTGKLTSSSTTYFAPDKRVDGYNNDVVMSNRSVDGLYHPNPPQYRYGFTPGGQYVDFFNMPTFCTTALTKMQRQSTKVTVSIDRDAKAAQERAESALKSGNKQQAQAILEQAVGGGN